jgi:hypothetical protein
MSGRSAYVRKEKTKVKDGVPVDVPESGLDNGPSLIGDFPMPHSSGRPMHFGHDLPSGLSTIKSVASSESDDLAYARVRKPNVPVIDVSGIEKSPFRSMMDKKSEDVRKGLAKTFGKKKKSNDVPGPRPTTSATVRPDSHELDASEYTPPLPAVRARQQFSEQQEFIRPGPHQGKLPPIQQGPQLKRWMGHGRSPQPWNKLRKDPELWDPNGDTLIFLGHETHQASRPPPSFRLSSHVLEATESRFLITLLREGSTDEGNVFSMPPSPISSPGMRSAFPAQSGRPHKPTPPLSENSIGGFDGQISYEIYFPAPLNQSKTDTLRHQLTTRNVFALLYQASLVGLNLFQALNDLHERLEVYMPPETDAAGLIIDYLITKGIDDVRNNPSAAAALLAWSESQGVRWEEGWREAYVHIAGMYNRLEGVADFRHVMPITRALLERSSLEGQVRVNNCEDRLTDFDFGDMWPIMSSVTPPARASFERLRRFFLDHFQTSYGSWPPAAPAGEDQWLTRSLAQKLQKDFGALYDYLVNREITWDCSEERSGRKWNIVNAGNRAFDADSLDLPFTDILVAFDNRHKYPHIPHPYPLVPESIQRKASKENMFNLNKKSAKPTEGKMAERKAALAYTESTNIYLLGSDFVSNDLVDAFVRFEKADREADVDPYAARRGRWVSIYFILQTLASVSVDTPNLRHTNDVSYHLNPRLRGTPPWKGANQNLEEASHVRSYCWAVRNTWQTEAPVMVSRRVNPVAQSVRSSAPSVTEIDEASVRPPIFTNVSSKSRRNNRGMVKETNNTSYTGYAPGIERVDEWPILEEGRNGSRNSSNRGSQKELNKGLTIKDFDDFYE